MEAEGQIQSDATNKCSAPIHLLPIDRIVSIEHPCIIRNLEKGFKSLGGEAQLKHVLEYQVGDSRLSDKQNQFPEPVAGLSLRPNDPFAKKLTSTGVETRNLLVKVTVPKRTGRKRKRGSDEPYAFTEQHESPKFNITAPELLQRIRDNEDNYAIQLMGMLRDTHRFRTLPDFQIRASDLPIMHELREHAMKPDYDKLKAFTIDPRPSGNVAPDAAFPGPPSFTSIDIPHKYEYQQAAGIVVVTDERGNVTSRNMTAPQKRVTWGLAPDVAEVPSGPPADIRARSPHGEQIPLTIAALQKLLAERPLVTKRVALNALPPVSDSIFKEATQWVGYSFRAGPWRDSLIRYGVDPRKDAQYRVYQTLMFQVDKEAFRLPPDSAAHALPWTRPLRHQRADPATHIFDGVTATANGKTWQVCDVTDPVVSELFATRELRAECDVYQWGWFYNGTMAKARVIMKDKMKCLFAGEEPADNDYRTIAALPNTFSKDNMHLFVLASRTHGVRLSTLSNEVRSIAKTGDGSRAAKISEAKLHKGGGRVGATEDEDGDAEAGGEVEDEEDEVQGDFGEMDARLEAEDAEGGSGEGNAGNTR